MHNHQSNFELGQMAKEKISGVEGRIVGITFWETSCNHIAIKRLGVDKDGKLHEVLWFDEPNVDLVAEQRPELAPNTAPKPGGPLASGMAHSR